MIELNSKTQQDFLNREWVQRLLDAGVDMSDAKYYICQPQFCGMSDPVQVALKEELPIIEGSSNAIPAAQFRWCLPTYTVSELLYKLRNRYGMYTIFNCYKNLEADNISIIETLASFLIQCHKKDIGIKTKDTGDISNK